MLILTARYVLPVNQPAIRDGALLIEGSRIRAVGPRTLLLKDHPEATGRDLGEAILLPGLVNVHTHLELSVLRGQVHPGHSFVDWVLTLLERKQGLGWEAYVTAVEEGIAELIRSGTTCVGDVSSIGASFMGLKRSGLRGVVYREIIGLDGTRAEAISEMPFAHIEAMREEARGTPLDVGISPHAIYSVSPQLFRLCRQFQQRARLKAAIHAAESPAEIEYLRSGTGEIRRRLLPATGWGELPPPTLGTSPVAYLHGLGVLDPQIDQHSLSNGVMAVACSDKSVRLMANKDSHVMVIGGDPVGDRHIWWNFVSSSKDRIEKAGADWKARRFDDIPGETEFIPLPD